ncbi:carbon-nitrogen hydrolase [Neohortaea acidophila]|uniref:Carbon-nitrogen hydrolase n=1 Tax=Neohortaea acidophila TaxID=245834 RepID=A0A6A6PZW3_9PEZI|nr:carbon-nitrogen hydrolase [Neohortaea acidophila]KAF2484717.1 carbon-nitrogen hydrolase [Neohortaea acidophila]
MKIACLQFNPTLGAVQSNIDRANALLEPLKPAQLDLLILPELAFSGYNFPDLASITPYLEATTSGPTTQWAIATAQKLGCCVTVGYPEIHTAPNGHTKNYNSTVTVSATGEVLLNYRKSFLYYTDETWASEGPDGITHDSNLHLSPGTAAAAKPFFCADLPAPLGRIGHGICMDINPYKFTAPWTDFEFATAMLRGGAPLVVLSMAWLTSLLPPDLELEPEQPDMQTIAYWIERMFPLFEAEEEVVVVFANRCGVENPACYAGSSCVIKFHRGTIRMYERILGKGEEGVLVVDTAQVGFWVARDVLSMVTDMMQMPKFELKMG